VKLLIEQLAAGAGDERAVVAIAARAL